MATVDENNKALTNLINNKNELLNEVQSNYNNASGLAQDKYNELIQASKDYGEKQAEIQQQKTDQTIAEINQNKEKTERDYLKEQKGAYVDYANQTAQYGVNAEQMAAQGLTGSGYQESSRVSMYNTYQNRVATARQSFNDAIVQYDNQIAQAQIANSSALAEIAYNALQTQLQLSLEGLQYENELLQQLTNNKLNINTSYDSMWQSMYNTLLNEAQFNEEMAYQKERDAVADAQWEKEYALSVASLKKSSGSRSRSSGSDEELVVNRNGSTAESNGQMSSEANKLLNNMETMIKSGGVEGVRNALKERAGNIIHSEYSNGKITEDEADYIFYKLGI